MVKEHRDCPNSNSNGLILQVGKQSEMSGDISKIQVEKEVPVSLFGHKGIYKLLETPSLLSFISGYIVANTVKLRKCKLISHDALLLNP